MIRRTAQLVLSLFLLATACLALAGCGGEIEPQAEAETVEASTMVLAEPDNVTGKQRWLARVMFAEALSEPEVARKAVASVVLNRVEADNHPGTVYGVVHAKNGFTSVTRKSRLWRKSNDWGAMSQREKREWIECLHQAQDVLDGEHRDDIVAFKNVGVKSDAYFRSLRHVVTLGKLEFYAR